MVPLNKNPLITPLLSYNAQLAKTFKPLPFRKPSDEVIKRVALVSISLVAYTFLSIMALVGVALSPLFRQQSKQNCFESLPSEILQLIIKKIEDPEDINNFKSALYEKKDYPENVPYWIEYAKKIGCPLYPNTPPDLVYKTIQNFIKQNILSIKSLIGGNVKICSAIPIFIQKLLNKPLTLESIKTLIRFKKARDAIVFFYYVLYKDKDYAYHPHANYFVKPPSFNRALTSLDVENLEEWEAEAQKASVWFHENKMHYLFLTKLQLGASHLLSLTNLPEEVGELINVKEVQSSLDSFPIFPSALINMTKLKFIYLISGQLISLPSEIENLTELRKLRMYISPIQSIPDEIQKLNNLEKIVIPSHRLDEGPISSKTRKYLRKLESRKQLIL